MPLLLLSVAVLAVLGLFLLPAGVLILGVSAGLVARYGLLILALLAWTLGWGFLAQRGVRSEVVGAGLFGVPVLALLGYVFTLTRA